MSGDSKTSNEHESDGNCNDKIIDKKNTDNNLSIHIVSNHLC